MDKKANIAPACLYALPGKLKLPVDEDDEEELKAVGWGSQKIIYDKINATNVEEALNFDRSGTLMMTSNLFLILDHLSSAMETDLEIPLNESPILGFFKINFRITFF